MESLNIFIRSIFIDNMVFAFFFGMCSYIAVSKSVKTALGLGAAVTFVMVMTVPLNYLLYEYVLKANALVEGVDLNFLSFIVFIATIAAFVQLVEMIVEKFSPTLYSQLGIFLPLIAVLIVFNYLWALLTARAKAKLRGLLPLAAVPLRWVCWQAAVPAAPPHPPAAPQPLRTSTPRAPILPPRPSPTPRSVSP